jgi:hypothetical protein
MKAKGSRPLSAEDGGQQSKKITYVTFITVFAIAMAFALYTRHAWEDFYITYRTSKNLATGNGLVFVPGQRVHTFTSVLGTLIPAFLSFVTGNRSDDLVLWLYRIVNCLTLAGSAVLLVKTARKWFLFLPSIAVLVGVFALDTKTIDYTINGMETPYLLFALVLFFYFITSYPVQELKFRLGVVWALLEYSRPDGVVYVVLLSGCMLLFLKDRKAIVKTLAVSAGISLLLFAPWLIFTFLYYGTPIPHSMIAKNGDYHYTPAHVLTKTYDYFKDYFTFSGVYTDVLPKDFFLNPQRSILDSLFTPPNSFWLNIRAFLTISKFVAFACSLVWVIPGIKPVGRMASLTLFLFLIYLCDLPYFYMAWYLPGPTLLALISFAFLVEYLLAKFKEKTPHALTYGWCAASAFLVWMAVMTLIAAHQFRLMQAINERGNREKIGLWLKEHSKSNMESVFVECAGYIGFYSGLKLYDFPGMTSPEMVHARKVLQTNDYLRLVKYLKPDWLVLRPFEFKSMRNSDSTYIRQNYVPKMDFDVDPQIDAIAYKPYEVYFRIDSRFLVLRKASDEPIN